MDSSTVLNIARHELTVNIRNKWTVIFAIVFGALVVGISYVGIIAEGFSGMQSFTRTSASLLNLVLYLIPLVALTMGTLSFTGERGTTELLFSQPISRTEILVGKLAGLFLAMAISMMSGFVAAGAVIVSVTGTEGVFRYGYLVFLSLLLALVFLSLSIVVSMANDRKAKAFGVALFLWFFFVLFYDIVALGITLLLDGPRANTFLFFSIFGNPVDLVRIATLIVLDNVTIFGAAGAALLRFLGGPTASVLLLFVLLGCWIVLPVLCARWLLQRQDI